MRAWVAPVTADTASVQVGGGIGRFRPVRRPRARWALRGRREL